MKRDLHAALSDAPHREDLALQAAAFFGGVAATRHYGAEVVIKALHRTECYADAAAGSGASTEPSRRYGKALDVLLGELFRLRDE